MNRSRYLMLIALIGIASISAAYSSPAIIDLDNPGALDKLQAERPEHFQKVIGILQDEQRLPEKEVVGWLRTNYQTESAAFGPTLLVAYPPKRRLSFLLDAVRYHATVVVNVPQAVIVPAH